MRPAGKIDGNQGLMEKFADHLYSAYCLCRERLVEWLCDACGIQLQPEDISRVQTRLGSKSETDFIVRHGGLLSFCMVSESGPGPQSWASGFTTTNWRRRRGAPPPRLTAATADFARSLRISRGRCCVPRLWQSHENTGAPNGSYASPWYLGRPRSMCVAGWRRMLG